MMWLYKNTISSIVLSESLKISFTLQVWVTSINFISDNNMSLIGYGIKWRDNSILYLYVVFYFIYDINNTRIKPKKYLNCAVHLSTFWSSTRYEILYRSVDFFGIWKMFPSCFVSCMWTLNTNEFDNTHKRFTSTIQSVRGSISFNNNFSNRMHVLIS